MEEELSYEELLALIPDRDKEWLKENKAYADGDHWQDGKGWVGPVTPANDPSYADVLANIKKIFAPEDVINEILERHVVGVVGREPRWQIEGESAELDLIETALNGWLSEQRVMTALQTAVANALWSKRGILRIYIPAGQLAEGDGGARLLRAETLEDALSLIHVEAIPPDQGAVVLYGEAKRPLGVYTYQRGDANYIEMVTVNPETNETVVRIVSEGDPPEEALLPLGGQLTMYQMDRQLMITDAMRRLQKKINHASTAEQNNLSTAGFVARILLSAQLPGTWNEDNEGNKKFTPSPVAFGPGTINAFPGEVIEDEDGNVKIARPQYVREEPSSPETFIMTKAEVYKRMLHRAGQDHVLLSRQSGTSGEARLRARGDFENSLAPTKTQVEGAFVWLLETALALAGVALGRPEAYATTSATAEARLDVGVVTPEERASVRQLYKDNLISKKTALSWLGIDDVEAELTLIEEELYGTDNNESTEQPVAETA